MFFLLIFLYSGVPGLRQKNGISSGNKIDGVFCCWKQSVNNLCRHTTYIPASNNFGVVKEDQ